MPKQLKIWNGRGHGSKYGKGHAYVAAYSKAEACRLLSTVFECFVSSTELTNFYSPCWGISMDGIEPTEPCVYVASKAWGKEIPQRII
jgi:hypothetical protein